MPATRYPISPRDIEVAVEFRDRIYLDGISPTLQEVGDYLGVSRVTVHEHVKNLERAGVIRRDRQKARSVEILRPDVLPPMVRNTKIPVLGIIGGKVA